MELGNQDFATTNKAFRKACVAVGLEPTKRQASKYRNKQGLAFKFKQEPNNKWFKRQVKANLRASEVN